MAAEERPLPAPDRADADRLERLETLVTDLTAECRRCHQRIDDLEDALADRQAAHEELARDVAKGRQALWDVIRSDTPAVGADELADLDGLIPLHREYLTVTSVPPADHSVSSNAEIAARLFPALLEHGQPIGRDRRRLTSGKVRELIEREVCDDETRGRLDVKSPHSETVQRVMRFLADRSDGLVAFKGGGGGRGGSSAVVVDVAALAEYLETVADETVRSDGGGLDTLL